MKKELFYFGCIDQKGHYLFKQGSSMSVDYRSIRAAGNADINLSILGFLDGTFTPGTSQKQGLYNDCVVPPFRIVSWWDRSVDDRFGSSSTLVGIGYESAEEMLDAARVIFPKVMNRQPRPTPYTIG